MKGDQQLRLAVPECRSGGLTFVLVGGWLDGVEPDLGPAEAPTAPSRSPNCGLLSDDNPTHHLATAEDHLPSHLPIQLLFTVMADRSRSGSTSSGSDGEGAPDWMQASFSPNPCELQIPSRAAKPARNIR